MGRQYDRKGASHSKSMGRTCQAGRITKSRSPGREQACRVGVAEEAAVTEQRKGRRRGMTGFQGGQQEPGHVQPISQVRELESYPEDNGGHGRVLCR